MLLVGCGKKTKIEADEYKHYFATVGGRIELKNVTVKSNGKGTVNFDWVLRRDDGEAWSFLGSGITAYATQDGDDSIMVGVDYERHNYRTKIEKNEKIDLEYEVQNIDLNKPIILHFLPLEGEEWRLTININDKSIQEEIIDRD
ncbi:hypothetical protein [uncultured Helcococcus sp.]|uniref:hypothetical protein n=1 Tax=uncultured Helcococcus sp. TaxID=1072508 RepID=UPI0026346F03|nr:hypothetical protein [uncultured Helcococcus sp.]